MFSPRLAALLRDHLGKDVFRLEPDTIGVASGSWPLTGHLFLRDHILGKDPYVARGAVRRQRAEPEPPPRVVA